MKKIEERRIALGLTKSGFAREAGFTYIRYHRWTIDACPVSRANYQLLEDILDKKEKENKK